eukprot:CAMPEP_0194373944 /NCGR_PEP_ID=MMETSP0174-20130528/22318_1 /TAXON_ID=216777 /ORGANISM="Proboscia alata, Strain PI-D3" /LENGTH=455 /DNA_ID=CAMNT_0039153231 /DNA_START=49 /DNA_END=1416 /DNA_ORIENTATION=-
MPRRGGKRTKTRTHVVENENLQGALESKDSLKVPRTLVIRRGKVENEILEFIQDLRKLLLPHTALNLKEDTSKNRKAKLSDYATQICAPMGITHILALTQNASQINLRIARTPTGPTLSFKVRTFSLVQHVRSYQRRPYNSNTAFAQSAVVVTNNFGDSEAKPHVKLMRITFQNMFPVVNVATVKLGDVRRVVLFNLIRRKKKKEDTNDKKTDDNDSKDDTNKEEEDEMIEEVEMRHYAIRAAPVGVDRRVRRILEANKIPNLNRVSDIADYITRSSSAPSNLDGNLTSDSEGENDETCQVVLPQSYRGKLNNKKSKSALKLVELGPRATLQLFKVERGLGGGDVMYHAHYTKTRKEIQDQKDKIAKAASLKNQRREEQDRNVERKKGVKDEKLREKKRRREDREKDAMEKLRGGEGGGDNDDDDESMNDQDAPSDTEEEEDEGQHDDDVSSTDE